MERRRNVHFMFNRVTGEKLVIDDRMYNTLMVQLLIDVNWNLEQKSNDQIEFSLGWGQTGVIGRVGLKLNNFSMANLFNKNMFPIPAPLRLRTALPSSRASWTT